MDAGTGEKRGKLPPRRSQSFSAGPRGSNGAARR